MERFPTGLCHYVYDIQTASGASYVVRIATPSTRHYLEGGLYWHPRLKAAGVPIPVIHASHVGEPFSYMIMERLPGTDLGNVYLTLSKAQKKTLAGSIAAIQQSVATLPAARCFGFGTSYERINASGKQSWTQVVAAELQRSEERIRKVGRIDLRYVERVKSVMQKHEGYFNRISPTPFLDDTTTKNVIVNQGTLSGLVDTDQVCFGDLLFTVGLTRMALLSLNADTDYIDYWLDSLNSSQEQRAIERVYALVFCLNFLGEQGTTFNKPAEFDETEVARLVTIFERLIAEFS